MDLISQNLLVFDPSTIQLSEKIQQRNVLLYELTLTSQYFITNYSLQILKVLCVDKLCFHLFDVVFCT